MGSSQFLLRLLPTMDSRFPNLRARAVSPRVSSAGHDEPAMLMPARGIHPSISIDHEIAGGGATSVSRGRVAAPAVRWRIFMKYL